jgi:hypothetical protein
VQLALLRVALAVLLLDNLALVQAQRLEVLYLALLAVQ